MLLVADLKRLGRELVLSSHFVVSLADCALNVVEEREMRNLGKATRTLFVADSLVAVAAELLLFELITFVRDVFDALLLLVVAGALVFVVNLRLFALVWLAFVSTMKLESYLLDSFLNRVLRLPTFSAMFLLLL
jgi:hypothetical protein